MNKLLPLILSLGALLRLAQPVCAAITTYSGYDTGYPSMGGSVRTQSDAAAASFDAALGPHNVITFETAPLGPFSSLPLGSGVTLSGMTQNNGLQVIDNSPSGSPASLYGFNSTIGGTRYASEYTGTLTFSFASPIDAFGAYFSGVQQTAVALTFNDGSSETLSLIGTAAKNGGLAFFGFTDPGALISSITINAGSDAIGVDDVRFRIAQVPEPRTAFLVVAGFLSLAALQRRVRRIRRCT